MGNSTKTYNGRIEYRAVQAEVEAKLAAGFRVRPIYVELRKAGKISISYSTFCSYVRGKGERKDGRHKKRMISQGRRPEFTPVKPRGFHHDNVADLDELGPPKKK